MHKDAPPGIFELNEHSLGYIIGLGITVGFFLSVIVMSFYILFSDDVAKIGAPFLSR